MRQTRPLLIGMALWPLPAPGRRQTAFPGDRRRRASILKDRALAALCVLTVIAGFCAEVRLGHDGTALGALGVVPVLVSSTLRSRWQAQSVVALSVLLRAAGSAAGLMDGWAAAMDVAVYGLALSIMMLQQRRAQGHLLTLELAGEGRGRHPALDRGPSRDVAPGQDTRQFLRAGNGQGPSPAPPAFLTYTYASTPAQDRLPAGELLGALSRRERQVAALACQGLTAREIGAVLFIGERTVETHLAHSYEKLGVRSKVELARLAGATLAS